MAPGTSGIRGDRNVIEAELKARVHDPDALRQRLRRHAEEEISTYRDTYYDRPDRALTTQGHELRLRIVETAGHHRALLTYKRPTVDAASGSKPEHETTVADPATIDLILQALGMQHLVAFEKHCANYRFTANGRTVLATLATVPEIGGTFIELETMTDEADTAAALDDIRALLRELGVADDDLTTEQYTDAVIRART
jgi:adenylate cyclase class 2